jgi:hypothetical protein
MNCTDRKVGCHDACEKEAEYKAKVIAENKAAKAAYKAERGMYQDIVCGKMRSQNEGKKWDGYRQV